MPVPVTVVTGALGTGKSRLVNRLLDGGRDGVVVVESDWGDVAVEHDRVVAADPTELARTLARLARHRDLPRHVILEVADADAARSALSDEDVREAFELAAVLRGGDDPPVDEPTPPVPPGPAGAIAAEPPVPAALTPEALEPLAEVALPDWAGAVAWHPQGDLLAVACADGSVHEVLADGAGSAPVGSHDGGAAAVGYAIDGTLATGGADGRVAIGVLPPLAAGAGWVEPLAWAPDGGLLATAIGSRVQLWTPAGALAAEADPLGAPVDALAWAPDGGRLACGGPGGAALIGRDGLRPRGRRWSRDRPRLHPRLPPAGVRDARPRGAVVGPRHAPGASARRLPARRRDARLERGRAVAGGRRRSGPPRLAWRRPGA
jgi:hypothetical protein